ncbi:MAG: RNA polymerase sigma-70 factor [Tannerella sp.]|jgi:RNA polymerase sigma-70 factor (ECF subfamily)|nr:RNA polymerase sigma-70 factor [Tannerella sp.]
MEIFDLDKCWKKVQQGDVRAFEALYNRLYPALLYYAKQITGDHFVAEEILQDTFLKLWQNRQELFSDGASLKTYIYQAAHHQCINYLVHKKTQKQSFLQLASGKWWYEIGEQFAYDEQLLDALQAEETLHRIERLVEELPGQCREVFKLSRFEDKNNEEIAGLLGISVNTVKTHIYRALEKIRRGLDNE